MLYIFTVIYDALLSLPSSPETRLKNAFYKMRVTICGRFCLNVADIALLINQFKADIHKQSLQLICQGLASLPVGCQVDLSVKHHCGRSGHKHGLLLFIPADVQVAAHQTDRHLISGPSV